MIHQHNEIEAKLAVDNHQTTYGDFKRWVNECFIVTKFEYVEGPDHYYEQGENVIRHREKLNSKTHELTVKRRKSMESTRDREEIDLHFSHVTTAKDVRAFLEATGFKHVFTLMKAAHIFWLTYQDVELTIVMYNVGISNRESPNTYNRDHVRHFIEVEAEKGSDAKVSHAKRVVDQVVKAMQDKFGLGEPLNDSLYELYSGKKYQTV